MDLELLKIFHLICYSRLDTEKDSIISLIEIDIKFNFISAVLISLGIKSGSNFVRVRFQAEVIAAIIKI